MNLPAQAAADGHGGDAVHALEARGDFVFREFAQRDRVVFTLDAELDDRLRVRVELEDGRRVRIFRQPAADAIDARADFVGGLDRSRAPVEVQPHLAVAFRR